MKSRVRTRAVGRFRELKEFVACEDSAMIALTEK